MSLTPVFVQLEICVAWQIPQFKTLTLLGDQKKVSEDVQCVWQTPWNFWRSAFDWALSNNDSKVCCIFFGPHGIPQPKQDVQKWGLARDFLADDNTFLWGFLQRLSLAPELETQRRRMFELSNLIPICSQFLDEFSMLFGSLFRIMKILILYCFSDTLEVRMFSIIQRSSYASSCQSIWFWFGYHWHFLDLNTGPIITKQWYFCPWNTAWLQLHQGSMRANQHATYFTYIDK